MLWLPIAYVTDSPSKEFYCNNANDNDEDEEKLILRKYQVWSF